MAEWLIPLLRIGGAPVAVVIAGILIGQWLLKKIGAALDSYNTAYHQQKGAIDARMERIEKLVEEQARLTRTVESIKDEIAANRKSQDNRWAFRKEIYVSLINAITDLITEQSELQTLAEQQSIDSERLAQCRKATMSCGTEFVRFANLAPLATTDSVQPMVVAAITEMRHFYARTKDEPAQLQIIIDHLFSLRSGLQEAGRKDLWDKPETEAKAEADNRATSN
jgi:hypothetical protein